MLSKHAKNEWLAILGAGLLLTVAAAFLWWPLIALTLTATVAAVLFFRDPERRIPTQRGAVVAPADGRVSSVHELEHMEALGEPAICIRIFLSVFDVHINRSPVHGQVASISHKPGKKLNALSGDSPEVNEALTTLLVHPIRGHPVAAVRQIAGMLARTIVCHVREQQVVQRGERIGLIKLGSTTELYLPQSQRPDVQVTRGQKVRAGLTVVAFVSGRDTTPAETTAAQPADHTTKETA